MNKHGMAFSENDINKEIIDYVDKYFKTVIINTKINYLKKIDRNHKYGITFVSMEVLPEKSEWSESDEFEECNFKLKDEMLDISFSNMALATV